MNDLIPTQPQQPAANPFNRALAHNASVNAGAVSIETERAIAEAQGQMTLAKRFPRDLNAAHAEMMVACKSYAFASVAFYAKPQGGSTVTGPSIRMAEQLAQVVGNFQYGHRELSRDGKKSEVEVFAWDMEKNNYNKRQKTILHVRDTKDGPKPLRDQTDVDQKINNVASKEMRGLIIAMMPKWLVEEAIQECRKTLAGQNDEPIETRVRRMVQAFAKFGVKQDRLEKHLGHKLDSTTVEELVDLQGIHTALKDGGSIADYFPLDDEVESPTTQTTAAAIAAAAATSAPAKKVVTTTKVASTTKPAVKPPEKSAEQDEKQGNPVKDTAPAKVEKEVPPQTNQGNETPEPEGANADPDAEETYF